MIMCTANCLQCRNATACEKCVFGYYLLNEATCVSECPSGYFQNFDAETCDLCEASCLTCEESIYHCTSCFTPYVLNNFKCQSPPRKPPPYATLKSSSDPQTFILTFSNKMAITPDILTQNIEFSLTNADPSDYYLLQITAQPDGKTFRITFNFTKDMGIETLTVTFTNRKAIIDKNGLIINQDSVSAQTIRFTFFNFGEKAATDSITTAGSGVSNAALTSSIGMFISGGAGGLLWSFLGLFQIVNYLIFLNVNYPYNVVVFFKLFSVSSFEGMVPNPIEYLFPTIYEQMQEGLPSPLKFSDNDMDGLFLNNAGSTLAAWIAVIVIYGFVKIILFVFRTNGRLNKIITKFKEKFEWGIPYDAMIGTYPDLLIASCLQLNNMDFTTSINKVSSIAALIVGGLCFWAPFAVTVALESSSSVLGSEYHEKRHGALYEQFEIKYPSNVSPETAYYRRNFLAFVFLRKITYFCGIVLAYDIPILQMIITSCSGLVLLIFMIRVKPYRTKRDAWMNIGSEVLLVLIHLVIFIFAVDDMTMMMSHTQRKNVGWVVIVLCSTLVAYNAYVIFTEQLFAFWNLIKLMARVICKTKKKAENNKPMEISTLPHKKKIRYRDALINRLASNLKDSSRDDSRILQNRTPLFNPYSLSDKRKYQATRKQRIDK